MSWKEKAIKYCVKCKDNDRLFCKRYKNWQDKRTVNKCEFIQTMEEEKENDNSKN